MQVRGKNGIYNWTRSWSWDTKYPMALIAWVTGSLKDFEHEPTIFRKCEMVGHKGDSEARMLCRPWEGMMSLGSGADNWNRRKW